MELFKQAKLQYETGSFEQCWIPSSVAKVGKRCIDEDTKLISTVVEVYGDVALTREQLEINRYNPMRRATDI